MEPANKKRKLTLPRLQQIPFMLCEICKNILRWNGLSWVNVYNLSNAETNISNLQVSTG